MHRDTMIQKISDAAEKAGTPLTCEDTQKLRDLSDEGVAEVFASTCGDPEAQADELNRGRAEMEEADANAVSLPENDTFDPSKEGARA